MTRQAIPGGGSHSGNEAALLAAAMDAHRAGALEEAERCYTQLLAAEPAAANILRLAGILARERGELALSLQRLRAAADAATDDARPLAELGLSLLAAGQLDAAEHALRAALAIDPSDLRSRTNLGALLQYRGHLDAAIECYHGVLHTSGNDPEVACNLAATLADAGRDAEALDLLDGYLARFPAQPMLLAAKGAIMTLARRWAVAIELLEEATRRNPGDDNALLNLGIARRECGQLAAAEAALRQALRLNPAHARASAELVNLLGQRASPSAVELAKDFLARHPGERQVLAALALALRDGGDVAAADNLTDPHRWLRIVDLEAPAGWPDVASFLAALRDRVLADVSLQPAPASKATVNGLQSGELPFDRDPAFAALHRQLAAAVDASRAAWQAAGTAPVLRVGATGNCLLRAWTTVLGPGGYQQPHQHPLADISGVLYLQLPDAMAGHSGTDGWLEFGRPPARLAWRCRPPTRLVQPKPGRLVLFPSHLFHRTLPFMADGQRISIAFDAQPVAASG